MTAYTAPKTWTNEALVAGDMNTHIRDNLEAIKDPPDAGHDIDDVSDYATSSTTFVDVDADDFDETLTTHGGDILITFFATVNGSTNMYVHFDVDVDGTPHAGDDGLIRARVELNTDRVIAIVLWVKGLSAGSHTFTLTWKTGGTGTITLYGGQGGGYTDTHGQWNVREVS